MKVTGQRSAQSGLGPKKTAQSQLSTEKVVDAAARIADREGLEFVTLTRVARDLGTSQPALYRHIESFDALVRALGLRAREILAGRLTESAVGVSGEGAIRAMGSAWRQMVDDHPGLYAATDRYPCVGDCELEAAVERITATLGQALVAFDLPDDTRLHAARTLRGAFHGFSHLEAGAGHPEEEDLDDSFDHMIELLCSGVRSLAEPL